MSWYSDPQLFIDSINSTVYRVTEEFGIHPIVAGDFKRRQPFTFSRHLSLGNNKESDYDAFRASFPKSGILKYINYQGLVIYWDNVIGTGYWSREEQNSPFWNLPDITRQKSVREQALEDKISHLEEESKRIKKEKQAIEAENATLKAQVNREKEEKTGLKRDEIVAALEALEKKVLDLTLKPVHCCGGAGGGSSVEGPWITGHTVPSNWVPFRDLDVQPFSKNIPLMITKATGGLKFGDDNTTNVQSNRFYGGVFPIVVVDVAELTPNTEEARFDPDVWSCYNNAGISYAARKPFPSEMSIDAHKTC